MMITVTMTQDSAKILVQRRKLAVGVVREAAQLRVYYPIAYRKEKYAEYLHSLLLDAAASDEELGSKLDVSLREAGACQNLSDKLPLLATSLEVLAEHTVALFPVSDQRWARADLLQFLR